MSCPSPSPASGPAAASTETRSTPRSPGITASNASPVGASRCASPPILAFQWGVADEVREPADATAAYAFSYLFGLRTAAIDLDADRIDCVGPRGPPVALNRRGLFSAGPTP